MKRSTLIMGFALLVVAATLAITITFRNDPRRAVADRASETGKSLHNSASVSQDSDRSGTRSVSPRSDLRRAEVRDRYEVSIPVEALAGRAADEQAEFHQRADGVQRAAREKLERMTEEFELTAGQRAKMFPVLVRSTPGYDPVMQVGGVHLPADPLASAGEEMHELFDPEQQAQLEDKEIDRQLWWQDLFSRIETELIDSTGGMPMAVPADDAGAGNPDNSDNSDNSGGERVAPQSRGGGR